MTEEQVELRVEKMMDALDRQLMAGTLTQKQYDQNVADLNVWANAHTDKRSPQ